MYLLVTFIAIGIVVGALALAFSKKITDRLNHARSWARLSTYIALTLVICPGALWFFMLFAGSRDTRDARGEFAIFFLGPALVSLIYRVLPAFIAMIASLLAPQAKLVNSVRKIALALLVVLPLSGLVLLVRDLANGRSQIPENGWLFIFGCAAFLGGWLITHAIGWLAGFFIDPVDREIAVYTWGEGETQTLGCFVTFLIAIGFALLYGVVRFVKWA